MTPQEIELVRSTWCRALATRELLDAAIAARLPGGEPVTRAAWVVDTITHLAIALDRPTKFETIAAEILAEREPVTVAELEGERDALMSAIDWLVGPLSHDTARAWDLAIGLFADIVASIGLDPFALPPPAPPTRTAEPIA